MFPGFDTTAPSSGQASEQHPHTRRDQGTEGPGDRGTEVTIGQISVKEF